MIDYKTFFLISHNTDVDLRSAPTWDIHTKNPSEVFGVASDCFVLMMSHGLGF